MKDVPQEVELVGDRIVLRSPPREVYDEVARKFYSRKENMKHLPFFAKNWTEEEMKVRRESQRRNQANQAALNYDIFWKHNDEFIGIGGFRIVDKEEESAEFGIILDCSVWRQGLSTEAHLIFLEHAIEELGIEYLYAGTDSENKPMKTFFDKFHIPFRETIQDNGGSWDRYGFYASKDWDTVKTAMKSLLNK